MRGEDLYCRSVALDGLFELVREKGGRPLEFASEVKLDPESRNRTVDFVPWNAICDYLELCADRLDAPFFGLEWAMSLPLDARNSGPLLLLLNAAKRNLKDSLNLAIAYQKIHTNGVSYSYVDCGEQNEITIFVDIHPLSRPSRQYCEHILSTIVLRSQNYFPGLTYKRVEFQHSPSADPKLHAQVFPFQKIYNAERNTLVVDNAIFDVAPSRVMKLIVPFVQSYLNRRHKSLPEKTSVTLDVAGLLPNMLGLRACRITDVAKAMGIGEKKLQRLLREEGTTFSAVLDDVRRSSATRLLLESNISITRLARMLDYSGIESFNTACRRWYNLSPRQVRSGEWDEELKG